MITGEEIGKIILHPEMVTTDHLKELDRLKEKYPYCSSLHLLHLKGLANTNNLEFETVLKKTAIHFPDRAHLYQLIHSLPAENNPAEELATTDSTIEIEENKEKEVLNIKNDAPAAEESISVVDKEEVDQENQKQFQHEEDKEEEKTVDHETTAQEEKTPLDDDTEADRYPEDHMLTTSFISAAIENNYIQEISIAEADTPEEPAHEEQEENIADDANLEENVSDLESTATFDTPEPETTVREEKETPADLEPAEVEKAQLSDNMSFVEWLKYKKSQKKSAEKEAQIAKKETDKTTPKTPQKESLSIDMLLDKFIAEEPSISRPVKAFYNPAKTAKKSLEEPTDLVSETLAKIYLMQKNYEKAISAYEQLILRYPEKKTFFADQIKKIKEEIKKK